MDIYEALRNDHDELKPLLDQLVVVSEQNADTQRLLDQIRDMLIPHSRAEEAVFYNALREISSTKDLIGHSFREHMEAEAVLRTLRGLEKINVEWTGAAEKLREALLHHIEEEQGRIFTAARQVLLAEEARQMALAFQQAKREAQSKGDLANMGQMIANLMPSRFRTANRDMPRPPA